MNWKIQILLIVTAGVSSFSTHNSTPLIDNGHLFKPIIIPNMTKYFEQPPTTKSAGRVEAKDSEQPQEPTTLAENYSDEASQVSENSLKFSSRYSTKERDRGRTGQMNGSAAEVPDSSEGKYSVAGNGESQGIEKRTSFSERSDELDSSEEEEEDVRKYFDTNEPEESEVTPTTNEPSEDLPRSTSFQSSSYPDEDFSNYEIPSAASEEEEEKNNSEEVEEKRPIDDYHNSGSKNYHSVQTPLNMIQYRGPHSFREDFDSEKIRTRLVSPIRYPAVGHKWPYSRSQTREDLEDANEISENDETSLEQGIRKELKGKSKITGLELAVEKDEKRFDDKRKYNFIEERDRGKQIVKSLVAEEEKDHRRFPFESSKQYQVDEEPRYQPSKQTLPKLILNEGPRSSKPPFTTTPRNIFKDKPRQSTKLDIPQELAAEFQAHQFLGPVVFIPNGDQKKTKAAAKAPAKNVNKEPTFSKDLLHREKLDRDNLTSERIQKSMFGTGSADYTGQSFNHLEESEEMYNAILANIQSVFGLRIHTSKSSVSGSRSSGPGLEEGRTLTWSLPKRSQVA